MWGVVALYLQRRSRWWLLQGILGFLQDGAGHIDAGYVVS
jgi:hypothetical protein